MGYGTELFESIMVAEVQKQHSLVCKEASTFNNGRKIGLDKAVAVIELTDFTEGFK